MGSECKALHQNVIQYSRRYQILRTSFGGLFGWPKSCTKIIRAGQHTAKSSHDTNVAHAECPGLYASNERSIDAIIIYPNTVSTFRENTAQSAARMLYLLRCLAMLMVLGGGSCDLTSAPSGSPTLESTQSPATTISPTIDLSVAPTAMPTAMPTVTPSSKPTKVPSLPPTSVPSVTPTIAPTGPSPNPSYRPSSTPTMTGGLVVLQVSQVRREGRGEMKERERERKGGLAEVVEK